MQETCVLPLGCEVPWRRKWQPTPVFLPGEFHGQRSLVAYSPWGRKTIGYSLANKQQQTIFTDYRWINIQFIILFYSDIRKKRVVKLEGKKKEKDEKEK